jgi:DNA-binding MarR family transcriptional regulator
MKTSKKTAVYFRYLNLMRALQQDPVVGELDLQERQLLDILADLWQKDEPIPVLQLMNGQTGVMSPTTVHRRLKSLRKKGLVDLQVDDNDNRYKYVVPTPASFAYFDLLGECVIKGSAA